ncbi:unnamed protein product [Durusdinium trenchii]|uniref:Uncharacterized protein n=1 Tax=Durusdinium trenchii TaxID=1381693 RepID=A0ABP0N5X2_9DINO
MFEAYVASLHWSLTQFTPSTNNVAPTNSLERLFAIFVILLAMGCFSSFVGSITATVNALRSIQATKTKQHSEVPPAIQLASSLLGYRGPREPKSAERDPPQYVIRTEKLMDDPLMENEVTMLKFLPKRFRMGRADRLEVSRLDVGCGNDVDDEGVSGPGTWFRRYRAAAASTECHAAYLMQPGLIPIQEVCVYIGTLTEALDPAMDSWTAANAAMMYTSSAREKFTAVWAPVPVVGLSAK